MQGTEIKIIKDSMGYKFFWRFINYEDGKSSRWFQYGDHDGVYGVGKTFKTEKGVRNFIARKFSHAKIVS